MLSLLFRPNGLGDYSGYTGRGTAGIVVISRSVMGMHACSFCCSLQTWSGKQNAHDAPTTHYTLHSGCIDALSPHLYSSHVHDLCTASGGVGWACPGLYGGKYSECACSKEPLEFETVPVSFQHRLSTNQTDSVHFPSKRLQPVFHRRKAAVRTPALRPPRSRTPDR